MSTEPQDPRLAGYQRSVELQSRLDELNLFEQIAGAEIDPDFDREDYRVAIVAGRWHNHDAHTLLCVGS